MSHAPRDPSAAPVELRRLRALFRAEVRPCVGGIALLIVLGAAAPALETAGVWIMKHVVDEVLVPRSFERFGPLALALAAVTALDSALTFAALLLSVSVGERFLLAIRTRFFGHLLATNPLALERRSIGDLLSRMEGDAGAIETLLVSGVTGVVSDVLRVTFFALALLRLDWRLALVTFTVVPLAWFTIRRFAERIRAASREVSERAGSSLAVAEEALSAAALVQAYGRERSEVERFRVEAIAGVRARIAATRLGGLLGPVLEAVELAAGLSVIALGTWGLASGRLTIGGLLAFITYLGKMYGPLRGLGGFFSATVPAARAGAERIAEILDEPLSEDAPGARALPQPRGELAFEGVSFRYPGTDDDALSDIAFRLSPGRILAVVGPSGSGKSTLVKLLLGFCRPTAGRILLDGHDVAALTMRTVREAVALVPQEAFLWQSTVRENIAFGRKGATEEEIRAAARAADAESFISALGEGYDTPVAQNGRRLSGGQRQRVAIARALVRGAPVLVLDEPTTGLDPASAQRLVATLRRLASRHAVLVISHDPLPVAAADEVLVLDAGQVVRRGTPAEALGDALLPGDPAESAA